MEQLVRTPKKVIAELDVSSLQACPRLRSDSFGTKPAHRRPICPDRPLVSVSKIDELRAKITKIERPSTTLVTGNQRNDVSKAAWTLGIPQLDNALSGGVGIAGLEYGAIHEIKPQTGANISAAASSAAAIGFALRLAARYFNVDEFKSPNRNGSASQLVWCQTKASASELGHLYGVGLERLGIDASRIIFIEPTRPSDVLWSLEEALKSGAAHLVMGVLDEVNLIEARRLVLATKTQMTPCLLVTHGARVGCATAASRWRIAQCPSKTNLLDTRASGAFVYTAVVERCRRNPVLSVTEPFKIQWCDETHRFSLFAPMADRATASRSETVFKNKRLRSG